MSHPTSQATPEGQRLLALASVLAAAGLALAGACSSDSNAAAAGGNGGVPDAGSGSTGGPNIEGECSEFTDQKGCTEGLVCVWQAFLRAPSPDSCEYEVVEPSCVHFWGFFTATGVATSTDAPSYHTNCDPALGDGHLYYRITEVGVDVVSIGYEPTQLYDEWLSCDEETAPTLCDCACGE